MITNEKDQVRARAPAKINLELRVGGPRPDGYHELATVYQAVSLYDDLVATPAEEISVSIDGPHADGVPTGGDNLAVRAARLLAQRTGIEAGARLQLHKGIPVAAGLAGGSADAAAALVACDALWGAGLTREALAEVAGELGSDVPFSLLGGTAIGTGRGERLTPALARGEYHWVLALAGHGLSTPDVYAELDRLRSGKVLAEPRVSDPLMQALRSGDPVELGATLVNQMQPAACSLDPVLQDTLDLGRARGALGATVCGSGPTVAFLARDLDQAIDLAAALATSGLVDDVRRLHGPVAGARLVEPVRA